MYGFYNFNLEYLLLSMKCVLCLCVVWSWTTMKFIYLLLQSRNSCSSIHYSFFYVGCILWDTGMLLCIILIIWLTHAHIPISTHVRAYLFLGCWIHYLKWERKIFSLCLLLRLYYVVWKSRRGMREEEKLAWYSFHHDHHHGIWWEEKMKGERERT